MKCSLFLLLLLIGGPGNVMNMAVFWRQGLRERINLCLFALSLADELYLLQCLSINGERLYTLFTTNERYGPVTKWMANRNFTGFFGLCWVSQIMSAIIASERCFCVVSPFRSQLILTTRTMAIIIAVVYAVVLGLYFLVASRYHLSCVLDPVSGLSFNAVTGGEFYHQNKVRDNSSSCSGGAAGREVGVTRMLVGASMLFIACVTPILLFRVVLIFVPELNSGRRYHNVFFVFLWLLEVLSYINSSLNVLVYYVMGSRYRHTLRGMTPAGLLLGAPTTTGKAKEQRDDLETPASLPPQPPALQ
ncbi:uncharacterized protein LOC143294145 [Babylonia areolata]|uniref:uncharacterized protein LOC143294145 n=1 Tax=Babylonia areolata TaxID=304850 RepID=UPI003FD288AD